MFVPAPAPGFSVDMTRKINKAQLRSSKKQSQLNTPQNPLNEFKFRGFFGIIQ